MCLGKPSTPAPVAAPTRPPPQPVDPDPPQVGDEGKRKSDPVDAKRRGRSSLRIDLGIGGETNANKASGLAI